MTHVNVVKLSFYIYQMKAYSFSFEVVQTVFQKNPSYDALNKNMHSKRTKKENI